VDEHYLAILGSLRLSTCYYW